MPLYRLTVRELIERTVTVDAPSLGAARRTRRAEWQDGGDAGTIVDYWVDDVEGPPTVDDLAPDPFDAWAAHREKETS